MDGRLAERKLHIGSTLRVAIVHARWNMSLITPLVEGARKKLLEGGVKESNIVIQSVPGSWELPVACQRYTIPYQSNPYQFRLRPCLSRDFSRALFLFIVLRRRSVAPR